MSYGRPVCGGYCAGCRLRADVAANILVSNKFVPLGTVPSSNPGLKTYCTCPSHFEFIFDAFGLTLTIINMERYEFVLHFEEIKETVFLLILVDSLFVSLDVFRAIVNTPMLSRQLPSPYMPRS